MAAALLIFSVCVSLVLGFWLGRARGWRIAVPWTLSILLLGVATADPRLSWGGKPSIALLVDLSPSTRGFWFRDAAALRSVQDTLQRVANVSVLGFADSHTVALDLDTPSEIRSTQTALPAVNADAVVLLSDGQLPQRTADKPVFAVVAPDDRPPADARITDARFDHKRLSVSIQSATEGRTLRWPDGTEQPLRVGRQTLERTVEAQGAVAVSLDASDPWPENDRMQASPTSEQRRRMWIGEEIAIGFDAADAIDLSALAQCGVVVLNDVPIASLSLSVQQDLAKYVRDFGGSLVIGGGPNSLSAGGYGDTVLDALSPLASLPPAPSHDLFVLVDSSGSMASATNTGVTKLDAAVEAMRAIDRIVPKTWSLRAGSIARELRWWPPGESDAGGRIVRPADLAASGPTNLAAAIRAVLEADAQQPKRLILLSDGQAEASSITALSSDIAESRLTIDWLALPPADPNSALANLVRASGGRIIEAADADTWRASAEALARASISTPMLEVSPPISVPPVGPIHIDRINAVSMRDGASLLASVETGGAARPAAASWNAGLGKVITLAFRAPPDALAAVASANTRPARDPRFITRASADSIALHARDANGPMNRLSPTFFIENTPLPLEQTAPGVYSAQIERSNQVRFASVRLGEAVIDHVVIPSRYPREFDAIGLDVDALQALADASGGQLVRRDQLRLISSALPTRPTHGLRTPALLGGFFLLALALIWSRRSAA